MGCTFILLLVFLCATQVALSQDCATDEGRKAYLKDILEKDVDCYNAVMKFVTNRDDNNIDIELDKVSCVYVKKYTMRKRSLRTPDLDKNLAEYIYIAKTNQSNSSPALYKNSGLVYVRLVRVGWTSRRIGLASKKNYPIINFYTNINHRFAQQIVSAKL